MSLCLGIDPDLPPHPFFQEFFKQHGGEAFCKHWSEAILAVSQKHRWPIKLQSAFFERWGDVGFSMMKDILRKQEQRGLQAILDWKRCDIASTMKAYGDAAEDYFGASWMTVHMSMGTDIFAGLRDFLAQPHRGVFFVWAGSNPSSQKLFWLPGAEGRSFGEVLLEIFQREGRKICGDNQLGYVLGATSLNDAMVGWLEKYVSPKTPFLMPGLGAQGGQVTPLLKAFLQKFSASLLPVSRGMTEIQSSVNLGSWDDVAERFAENALSIESSLQ